MTCVELSLALWCGYILEWIAATAPKENSCERKVVLWRPSYLPGDEMGVCRDWHRESRLNTHEFALSWMQNTKFAHYSLLIRASWLAWIILSAQHRNSSSSTPTSSVYGGPRMVSVILTGFDDVMQPAHHRARPDGEMGIWMWMRERVCIKLSWSCDFSSVDVIGQHRSHFSEISLHFRGIWTHSIFPFTVA